MKEQSVFFEVSVGMNIQQKKVICIILSIAFTGFFTGGCGGPVRTDAGGALVPEVDLGATIGLLAEVFSVEAISVEGYALVGGLKGTGSAECPPQIRAYLEQYILRQLPKANVEDFINSRDTAVVLVQGIMPATVSRNRYFVVKVVALVGTQTTSLEGGELWGAELKEAGRFGVGTKVLARAEGPVFADKISTSETDKNTGYVLAGGRVLDEYRLSLSLRRPDYKIANLIRNRLNERFGPDTARAVSPSYIEMKVPAEYIGQKQRFVSIVKSTYLVENSEITKERIRKFARELAVSQDKYASEIMLEGIGHESLGNLASLLNSSSEQVRLRAARCMLNLGSDQGLEALRTIALDKSSSYRIEALEAITTAARRNDASAISRRLLQDEDFDLRLAAYESLRKLEDISITQKLIAGSFFLEQVIQTRHKGIFVSRSGQPRIVLFGAPIYCREGIFVQSADGDITINSPAGQKYVSVMRRHPGRPNVILRLKSTFELGDIIQRLCESAVLEEGLESRPGLGVSYSDAIALLKQLSDKGAVQARFRAGSLPKIGLIIKK